MVLQIDVESNGALAKFVLSTNEEGLVFDQASADTLRLNDLRWLVMQELSKTAFREAGHSAAHTKLVAITDSLSRCDDVDDGWWISTGGEVGGGGRCCYFRREPAAGPEHIAKRVVASSDVVLPSIGQLLKDSDTGRTPLHAFCAHPREIKLFSLDNHDGTAENDSKPVDTDADLLAIVTAAIAKSSSNAGAGAAGEGGGTTPAPERRPPTLTLFAGYQQRALGAEDGGDSDGDGGEDDGEDEDQLLLSDGEDDLEEAGRAAAQAGGAGAQAGGVGAQVGGAAVQAGGWAQPGWGAAGGWAQPGWGAVHAGGWGQAWGAAGAGAVQGWAGGAGAQGAWGQPWGAGGAFAAGGGAGPPDENGPDGEDGGDNNDPAWSRQDGPMGQVWERRCELWQKGRRLLESDPRLSGTALAEKLARNFFEKFIRAKGKFVQTTSLLFAGVMTLGREGLGPFRSRPLSQGLGERLVSGHFSSSFRPLRAWRPTATSYSKRYPENHLLA